MAFRRPLKYTQNKNSTSAGGDAKFQLMSNEDIDRIRQQAIFELSKNPVYDLRVTTALDSDGNPIGNLDTISDTRITSAAAVLGTASSFPSDPGTALFGTVNTNYKRLRDSTDSCGFDSNAYLYLADTAPRPLCLDSDRGQILMEMPLQDVFDTFIRPALDSFYADVTNIGDSNNYMRPGLYLIGGGANAIHTDASVASRNPAFGVDSVVFQELDSADVVFADTVANPGAFAAGAIGTVGTFQDAATTSTSYFLQRTINPDSGTEYFTQDSISGNVVLPLKYEENAQKGYGHPGLKQFSRNEFKDYLQRAMRFVSGGETNYRHYYIIDSGATGSIMGSAIVNTEIVSPGSNFQTRLADPGASDPNDYRGQEFPTGTPSAVNTQYLKFVRH
jgi:hypothetical protein